MMPKLTHKFGRFKTANFRRYLRRSMVTTGTQLAEIARQDNAANVRKGLAPAGGKQKTLAKSTIERKRREGQGSPVALIGTDSSRSYGDATQWPIVPTEEGAELHTPPEMSKITPILEERGFKIAEANTQMLAREGSRIMERVFETSKLARELIDNSGEGP